MNAIEKLINALRDGVVNFEFKKKDGSLRKAVGTTNLDLIPTDLWPVGNDNQEDATERQLRTGCVTFFDMEKMAWRSCRGENILTIEGDVVCG